jgi:hypothetical protein
MAGLGILFLLDSANCQGNILAAQFVGFFQRVDCYWAFKIDGQRYMLQ